MLLHETLQKNWKEIVFFFSFCNLACISEVAQIKGHLNLFKYLLASFHYQFGQFFVKNLFKNVSHVFSSQKMQLVIKNAAKLDNI